jgi:hypothetical protein
MDLNPIGSVFDFANSIVNKIFPDATQKQKDEAAQLILDKTQEYGLIQGQIEINKIEGASESIFKSGWRPFIGWTCGVALNVQFVIAPFATWIAKLCGKTLEFPQLDMATLMPLVVSLLGLGAYRSVEKIKGTK